MQIIDQCIDTHTLLIFRGYGNLAEQNATISLLQAEVASGFPAVLYPRSVISTANPVQIFPFDAAPVITTALQEYTVCIILLRYVCVKKSSALTLIPVSTLGHSNLFL
jgi:hypothetical protein